MFLPLILGISVSIVSMAQDIPSMSACVLNTLPTNFCNPSYFYVLIIALVPINLYPDTEIVGPTSLNAINFITLGIPSPSDYGHVTVESFILENGWLFERSGLSVHFSSADGFDEN